MTRRVLLFFGAPILLSLACNFPIAAAETVLYVPPTATAAAVRETIAPSATPTETPTPGPTATETRPFPCTIVEQTQYEGEKTYTCDAGGCWRDDGTVGGPTDYFYPNIDEDDADIRALLNSIGLPQDVAGDDAERWRRIRAVWQWMTSHTVIIGEPGYEDPWNYLLELMKVPKDHWPSIGDMAKVFAKYDVLPLGACNSKAFTAATLLYRVGVRPDTITVAHSKAHDGTNHLYLAIRLDGRWGHVDPTCIREHKTLAEQPEIVGCLGADYRHPFEIVPLPGSTLTKPMLLE